MGSTELHRALSRPHSLTWESRFPPEGQALEKWEQMGTVQGGWVWAAGQREAGAGAGTGTGVASPCAQDTHAEVCPLGGMAMTSA